MSGPAQSFVINEGEIRNDVFIPKYYDPELESDLSELEATHLLPSVGELISRGQLAMRQGNYIPKMHYGTGITPYIRTSDLANLELRGSPKHGVSDDVADVYRAKQSIKADDVLLVHEGTYLIGTAALITRFDTDILYQHHVARLRVTETASGLTGPLLMCALLSPVVQRQIRNRQFTADVIDSIVGRLLEVRLPIPRDVGFREELSAQARAIFDQRAEDRLRLAVLSRGLDAALKEASVPALIDGLQDATSAEAAKSLVNFLGGNYPAESFVVSNGDVRNDILLPRYYDPGVEEQLARFEEHNDLITVEQLVSSGVIDLQTGVEVGKLAYGTGPVAFVRTSDLGNWELKQDPKQRVSESVYNAHADKQAVAARDILLVRDGTYLVGSSGMVMPDDLPMLISGGMFRIRVNKPSELDPFLLLALLNSQIAGRQMRNKRFTRDVIDTLGKRFGEVVLPVPKSASVREALASTMEELVTRRSEMRVQASKLGTRLTQSV